MLLRWRIRLVLMSLMANNPSSTLITYGPDVGLPTGQMGNSEVGHMNIGAGRVVEMDLRKIEGAIERGEFASLPGIVRFADRVEAGSGVAHLCGVLSDGGVHSHVDHMIETAKALEARGLQVRLHLFGDGRDVAPKSAKNIFGAFAKFHWCETTQIVSLTRAVFFAGS